MLAQSPSSALPNAPGSAIASRRIRSISTHWYPSGARTRPDGTPTLLTRQDAEKIALANNPRIHISQLIARVQHQAVRERRADELPNLNGNVTAVEANDGSRISSGSLTASRLLDPCRDGRPAQPADNGLWTNAKSRRFGETAGEGATRRC